MELNFSKSRCTYYQRSAAFKPYIFDAWVSAKQVLRATIYLISANYSFQCFGMTFKTQFALLNLFFESLDHFVFVSCRDGGNVIIISFN